MLNGGGSDESASDGDGSVQVPVLVREEYDDNGGLVKRDIRKC